MENLDLIAHPVRLLIIHALTGSAPLTVADLAARIPDVSTATLYRQVGVLEEAAIVFVDSERKIRGAVERRFALRAERGLLDAAGALSAHDHRRVFATAVAILLAEFDAYLAQVGSDPANDQVGYRQHALWLDPAEREALIEDLREAIVPRLGHTSGPGRSRYLLSPILFPAAEAETLPE